jgi:acetylornithine deacetylase/succinyl-diaminopimelate desuccinylase-like protein
MHYTKLPPLEELKKALFYNPDTGLFIRKHKVGTKKFLKAKNHRGYVCVGFKNKTYYGHRLAYYMHYGVDPMEKVIDHINHDISDNRIKNLRLVTQKRNSLNRDASKTQSGIVGVTWDAKMQKWLARLTIGLGSFEDVEEAKAARVAAEKRYYGCLIEDLEDI